MLLGLQVALWYVAVQAATLAVLPLSQRVFARLPDRGYALSRPLGLLLLAWSVWLPGMLSFLDYTRGSLLVALAALASINWLMWGRATAAWLRTVRGSVVFQEALFLLLLGAAAAVRIYNPDVNGQEKFMDMAFFNSFMSTRVLPAEDAWLSGYSMPYYPFGYLLMSVPARLAGLPAAVGYNLAL
ncbi:MAG: hypothetical protein IT307_16185, partial [Chloroflexi bacterium]|nr:hypothetical protein [Chloroflexota bacterium]